MNIHVKSFLILVVFLLLVPVSINLNQETVSTENVDVSNQYSYVSLNVAHAGFWSDVASALSSIASSISSALSGGGGGGGTYDEMYGDPYYDEGACMTCDTLYTGPDRGDVGVAAGVDYRDVNGNGYLDSGDVVQGGGGGGGGGGGITPPPRTPGVELPPSVTLLVRSQFGSWTGDNITIYAGDDLDLRWNSLRSTSCSGVAFTVTPSGALSGTQNTVTGPVAGASVTYTVNCTGVGGSGSDSLTVTAQLGRRPQCSDNVDNIDPEDTLIDFDGGGPALPATYNFTTQHPESAYIPYRGGDREDIKSTIKSILGFDPGTGVWLFYNDQAVANQICNVAGYGTATRGAAWSFSSESNNSVLKWNGSTWQTFPASGNNSVINRLTCSVPLLTPGAPDPGCVSLNDDDETDGVPAVELTVRNGNSSWTGNNITISSGNNISLRWASSNATQCTATAFSIGATTNVSGTQSTVTEPAAGASTLYSITCTGPSGPAATDSLTVTTLAAGKLPTLDALPMIVRSGEESKISWDVGTADPAECSIIGFGNTLNTLPDPVGDITIPLIAETVFTLSCPLGSDSVTVRVLPVIQES